jgi:hypothetical protein
MDRLQPQCGVRFKFAVGVGLMRNRSISQPEAIFAIARILARQAVQDHISGASRASSGEVHLSALLSPSSASPKV